MRIAAGRVTLGLLGFVFLIAVFILLASIPGESADPGARPADSTLAVSFALPTGPVTAPPTIDVLWNRPMRAVGKDTRGDEASLLQITPPVPGRRMWIGSRALRLVPDHPLPRATAFTGRVPAGTKDATGTALPAAYEWTFSTELPAVTGIAAVAGTRYLDPSGPIAISFNQPVDKMKVARAVRLTTDAGRTQHPITVTAADSAAIVTFETGALAAANLSQVVLVRPDAPLPPATQIDLEVLAADLAAEGPLPMAKPYQTSLRTRGPLELLSAEATATDLALEFSTPVIPDSLLPLLRLEGPAVRASAPPPVTYGGRQASARVNLGVPLHPGKALTIIVGPELRDRFGQSLGREARLNVTVQDLVPELRILPENATIEARGAKRQALAQATNVQHITVRAAKLSAERAADLLRRPWMIGEDGDPFKGLRASQRTHQLPATRNQKHSIPIPLDDLVGPNPAGGYVLVRLSSPDHVKHPLMPPPNDTLRAVYSVVQITDLGLIAKVSAPDLLIWTTSLHTGEPLDGVDLRIANEKGATIWRGQTDAGGLVQSKTPIPWETARGWTLVGKRGKDEAILLIDQDWELSPWAFNLQGDFPRGPNRSDVFLFSDRELYRPGDRVHVKGIVRARGRQGLGPAALDSVRFIVSNPRGDDLLDRRLALNEFGTVTTDFLLPPDALLGYYWGRIEPTSPKPELDLRGQVSFRLEAYRPAPFQLELSLAGGDTAGGERRLVRGDKLTVHGTARTFYDAPIAGARSSFVIRREQAFAPPEPQDKTTAEILARYGFDDPYTEESPWGLVTTEQGKLNDAGEGDFAAVIDLDEVQTPQTLEVEMEVRDAGDRSVASTRRIDWFPAAIRLGLRAEPQVATAGAPVAVTAVTTDLAGKSAAGTPVTLHWIERKWNTVLRPMAGGRLGYESEAVDTVLDSAVVNTTADLSNPIAASFTPPTPGAYLVRATASDRAGRITRSARFVYAAGPGYVPWSRDRGPKLTLVADRESYSPGDTATVLVQSPFPNARGLLTIEREGIHVAIPFPAQSSAPTVKIPLGEEAVPNLFASVVLVRGSGPGPYSAPDDTLWSGTPEVAIGYANLAVKPIGRELAVRVTSPPGAGPGDSVQVQVTVTRESDGTAADAEVALFLVDEAVLHLLGTKTPDPFEFFYRPQGLGVVNAAKALHVVESPEEAEKGGAPGGGGGEGGRFRRLFAATAAFIPELRTGEDGVVETGIRLPDNLTTFRAMAIACDRRDRLGSGEAPLTVTRPLVMEPIVPRIARVGDTFEVGAVLTNRTKGDLKVRTELAVAGPGLTTESRSTEVTIKPGKNQRVRFPVTATAAGAPEIQLSAVTKGGKGAKGLKTPPRDAVAFPLAIVEPTITVADAHFGRLVAPESLAVVPVQFDLQSDPRLSAAEIELSTSAVGGLETAIGYLLDYPHECLEQLDSRLIGLAIAKEFAYELIIPGWTPEKVNSTAKATVAEIASLATYDGGYRVWPALPMADPYLSAYTLLALISARDAGIAVSDDALRELGGYLKRQMDSKRVGSDGPSGRALRNMKAQGVATVTGTGQPVRPFDTGDALTAMLLAHENRRGDSPLAKQLAPADLDRMHRHLDDFDPAGKLFLASALNEAAKTDARVGAIVTDALNKTSFTAGRAFLAGSDYYYFGDEGLTAIALRTLLSTWPDHEMVPAFARWLSEERRPGYWRNTHATAFALLALRDLARREGRSDPTPVAVRASLGNRILLDQTLGGTQPVASRVQWSLAQLTGVIPGAPTELRVARSTGGEKPVYHAFRLTSARPALSATAMEAGLILMRAPHAFDPQHPESEGAVLERAKAGDPVRIELLVIAPRAATDVVLEDPLPAGLEPIVLDFQTTAQSLGLALAQRELRAMGYDMGYGGEGEGEGDGEYAAAPLPPGVPTASGQSAGVFPAIEVQRHDDRVVAYAPWLPAGIHRFEYLVRAATPGSYQAPPAKVELMYDPEVHGSTGAMAFTVERSEK